MLEFVTHWDSLSAGLIFYSRKLKQISVRPYSLFVRGGSALDDSYGTIDPGESQGIPNPATMKKKGAF